MVLKRKTALGPSGILTESGKGRSILKCRKNQAIFSQGDPADAVFYVQKGRLKVTVVSARGKEAVAAILDPDEFFGEACMAGQTRRLATVSALTDAVVVRIEKQEIIRLIQEQPAFSQMFMTHILNRTIRVEADLVDQLFNSSEKRLARLLIMLAQVGKEAEFRTVVAPISQEVMAARVGTTRSRINYFMNKFRKLGLIEYNGTLKVHSALLNVIVRE